MSGIMFPGFSFPERPELRLLALLCLPAFAATYSIGQPAADDPTRRWTETRVVGTTGAGRLVAGFVRRNYETSLESKETVDFLLAPALFVQESLSPVVIPGALKRTSPVGHTRFDAIIAVREIGLRPPVELYVRYWVSAEDYRLAIVWVEPHGRDLRLPLYPPTLRIASDAMEFTINSDVLDSYNQKYRKPISEEHRFTGRFGNYPIGDIRFAELEALSTRIYADDIRAVLLSAETVQGVECRLPTSENRSLPRKGVLRARVSATRGRVDSIQLLSEAGLSKSIKYDFEVQPGEAGEVRLARQRIDVPERTIMASLPGEGIQVTVNGKPHQVKEVPLIFQKGGRKWSVEYETVRPGTIPAGLPVRVSVQSATDGTTLRSAELMGFKDISEMSFAEAGRAASGFAGFDDRHRQYRRLLTEFWKKAPKDVPEADLRVARELRNYFLNDATGAGESLGQQLRRLNILMELSRLSGERNELEGFYEEYLETLRGNRRFDMLLSGGYGAIDTLMLWKRFAEADALLGIWLDKAQEISDIETVRRYAIRELSRGNLWATFQLLDRFAARSGLNADVHLELIAMKCLALDDLMNPAPRSTVARAQADWVASSTSASDLGALLTARLRDAFEKFERLEHPNDLQTALRKRLESVRAGKGG